MIVPGGRVLIVGGVRRLGRELALDLARHGASVCISSRSSSQAAASMVKCLKAAGSTHAAAVSADVRRPAAAEDLVRRSAAALGGLDGVVFAASGPFEPRAPQAIGEDAWNDSLDTIAKGFFFTACAARNEFVAAAERQDGKEQAGVIVAITDLLGLQPWAMFAAHGAAKAAQIHLVKQLARAWAPDGVRVCGIAPGPVDLTDDERRDAALRTAANAAVPRLVAAADIGQAVRFCLETDALTGVNIAVDNGSLLRY